MKRDRSNERGQAMVEFTLIATVLATLMLAIFQFGVVFSDYISVADAARAAARKASSEGAGATSSPANVVAARQDARDQAELSSGNSCLAKSWCTTVNALNNVDANWYAGMPVTARTTAPYSISVFGINIASGTLSHSVTMRIENKAGA
jgi:Flp pilus assembly protein TadG